MPEPTRHWSLTNLKDKLIKIGARLVRHGHYVTFQIAQVAARRASFADILRLISGIPSPARVVGRPNPAT